jgi:membrane fusion protein (multidrug efflux system)
MEDGREYPEPGRLQFSDVTVDQTTGSIRLRAVFANPREELLPGLFVRAVIQQAEMDAAIQVPQQAVQREPGGGTAVWLVSSEGKVVRQAITVGQAVGNKWLVDGGLKADDVLIVQGFQKTRPGASVKAVPIGEPVASGAAPSAVPTR